MGYWRAWKRHHGRISVEAKRQWNRQLNAIDMAELVRKIGERLN